MSDKLTPEQAAKARENGKLGGAPTKPIDYVALDKACAIHCTGEECASLLNVSYEHLNNQLKKDGHGGFLDYFRIKSAHGKMSLRRRQYAAAVNDGNTAMMIWLGKQWLDQRDKQDIDQTSTVNFSNALEEALDDNECDKESTEKSA